MRRPGLWGRTWAPSGPASSSGLPTLLPRNELALTTRPSAASALGPDRTGPDRRRSGSGSRGGSGSGSAGRTDGGGRGVTESAGPARGVISPRQRRPAARGNPDLSARPAPRRCPRPGVLGPARGRGSWATGSGTARAPGPAPLGPQLGIDATVLAPFPQRPNKT